jgi:hypothetical protein
MIYFILFRQNNREKDVMGNEKTENKKVNFTKERN